MTAEDARARLSAHIHGVLCTLHPERGPDPQPVVYAVNDDDLLGIAIDTVKPKASSRLKREANLAADPRATLLIEHWEVDDWSRLWWVRSDLLHVPEPTRSEIDDLADRLSRTVPQYADRPFHRLIVCRIVAVTGWLGVDM